MNRTYLTLLTALTTLTHSLVAIAQTTPPASAAPISGASPVASSTAPASAPRSSNEQEAEQLFRRGVERLQESRFAEAIELLERAHARLEVPAILFNLGFAYRGVGHFIDSSRAFERYIVLGGDRVPTERRREVESMLDEIRSSIAYVTIHSDPALVQIVVDGRPLAPERFGHPIALDPGRHSFHATGPGMQPLDVTRDIAASERIPLDLTPRPIVARAAIRVESSEPSANILLDRRFRARGRYEGLVPVGERLVEVRASGFRPFQMRVPIRENQDHVIRVRLARNPFYSQPLFWVVASAVVTGAVVGTVVALSGPEDPLHGSGGPTWTTALGAQ